MTSQDVFLLKSVSSRYGSAKVNRNGLLKVPAMSTKLRKNKKKFFVSENSQFKFPSIFFPLLMN